MPIRFQVDGAQLSPSPQCLTRFPVPDVEKPGFFRRLMHFGREVVTGGRQLKGAFMRLVDAKGTFAVKGLTNLSDTASTALSLGSMYPRGSDGSSSASDGLGILRSRSDGLPPGPPPSVHLQNARSRLRLTLASRSSQIQLDSPIIIQLNQANVQNSLSSTPAGQEFKPVRRHLYTVNEDSRAPEVNEDGQVKIMGYGGVRAHVVSRPSNATFYTITGSEGDRYSMECVPVDDEQSRQVLVNELNALRRVRGLQGIADFDVAEEQGKETYILMKWMGDIPLMDVLRNDRCYDLEFTVQQMARLLHAIHCMHLCGVIHGSVSTGNVMAGGLDGNFTLFNFSSSSIVSTNVDAADGDIPLWVPVGKALGLIDRKRRARSPYYDDYVALGHIWHEMRTQQKPINLGFGNYGVREGILFTDEMLFIRRLLTMDVDYRFKSVEELKRHAVFKNIDWRSFIN